MVNNEVSLNIFPQIPADAINLDPKFREKIAKGISLTFYENEARHPSGYGEGQERLLREMARIRPKIPEFKVNRTIMPALWMLAHAYLGSDRSKGFIEWKMILSSSARIIRPRKGLVYIAHNVLAERDYDRHSFDANGQFKVDQEGLAFSLSKLSYPDKPILIDQLVNDYPDSARALFLMNDAQLNQLLLRVPKGTMFSDSVEHGGVVGYSFGGDRREPFFGVTIATEANPTTYEVSLGEIDETEKTYSPKQFLRLSKALEALKKAPTPANIQGLEKAVRTS